MTPDPDAAGREVRPGNLPARARRRRPANATAGLAVSALPPAGIDGAVAPAHAMAPGALRLPVRTLPQPDETTCGPTCSARMSKDPSIYQLGLHPQRLRYREAKCLRRPQIDNEVERCWLLNW